MAARVALTNSPKMTITEATATWKPLEFEGHTTPPDMLGVADLDRAFRFDWWITPIRARLQEALFDAGRLRRVRWSTSLCRRFPVRKVYDVQVERKLLLVLRRRLQPAFAPLALNTRCSRESHRGYLSIKGERLDQVRYTVRSEDRGAVHDVEMQVRG